jgi:dipeptidyl aminopeptidase/acylaminoacyl peptidase
MRTSLLRLAAAGVFVAVLSLDGSRPAAQAPAPAWTPEMALTVKRILAVVPSPDGAQVAFVAAEAVMDGERSEWVSQIHLAAADGTGSRQLTRGEKSSSDPHWSPDGRTIAFVSSRNGKANIWRIEVAGGEAEMITDEKGGVSAFEWSPDGTSLAFVMRDGKTEAEEKADKEKRDWRTLDEQPKMNRLYVVPVAKPAEGKRTARLLTKDARSVNEFSWAPDSKTIVFDHQKTAVADDWPSGDLAVVTVADGTVTSLAAAKATESSPVYSPDGRSIAFTLSDDPPSWAGEQRVYVIPAAGGAPRALATTPDAQANLLGWSGDGKQVLISETHGLRGRVMTLPADGSAGTVLGGSGSGTGSLSAVTLNRSGTALGFALQDVDHAPEPHVARLAGAFTATKVATVQPAFTAPLGRSEPLTWKAPDGQEIEGILTYPVDYRAGTRVPLLLVIHGGPTGVFVRTFTGTAGTYPIAAFAARGYAVLRVNPRGSSGYGKTFRYANRADWGGGDYRDLMSGVDRVIAMGVADPERLGVMGWSYGGYMTSWIVTQTKRFKAASAGAAVTNLMSFTGVTDIPSFVPDYFNGDYWTTFDAWRTHSAMFNVKGVTTPTLIQHGEADDRVPISQGYEFYNALKRQGVTTKMTVYPRQPHGFTEPKMTLDAARANLEWFDRFVMGRTPTTSP